jgi:hypothetical protein
MTMPPKVDQPAWKKYQVDQITGTVLVPQGDAQTTKRATYTRNMPITPDPPTLE